MGVLGWRDTALPNSIIIILCMTQVTRVSGSALSSMEGIRIYTWQQSKEDPLDHTSSSVICHPDLLDPTSSSSSVIHHSDLLDPTSSSSSVIHHPDPLDHTSSSSSVIHHSDLLDPTSSSSSVIHHSDLLDPTSSSSSVIHHSDPLDHTSSSSSVIHHSDLLDPTSSSSSVIHHSDPLDHTSSSSSVIHHSDLLDPTSSSSSVIHHSDLLDPTSSSSSVIHHSDLLDQNSGEVSVAQVSYCRHWMIGEIQHRKDLCLQQRMFQDEALVTSAASDSLWTHSMFSLIPGWMKRALFKRAAPQSQSRAVVSASPGGVTFQKCATISEQGNQNKASITLLTNNTGVSSSAMNLSNLSLSDNITGLLIQYPSYDSSNMTSGMQIFRKDSLGAGDAFLVSYTASLNTTYAKNGLKYVLSAVLTFQNSSGVPGTSFSIEAPFTITSEETSNILPNHGLHGAGFVIAFVLSFLVTCAIFLLLYRMKKLKPRRAGKLHQMNGESKSESPAKAADGVAEDVSVTDRLIDIIVFEEPEQMLPALDDSEIAGLTQADAYLEVCRIQVCKDVTWILLKEMTGAGTLYSLEEKKISSIMNGHWSDLEKKIQEEHHRKMVALTAECNLDTKKQMEAQHRQQKEVSEEAEAITKHAEEKFATEYRSLLDKLQSLERNEMKRMLLFKQEEEFAKAYRQLAVTHRTELHKIVFDQVQNSAKAKPELRKTLIENYLKVQEEAEDLIDFLQATKKYHMNKRLAVRKNLLYNIQLGDSRSRCQLNSAATQIANLINRTERAGYINESQAELLLEKAQSEVLKVKQKLETVLKQEKRKLHQRFTTKRNRQILQRLKDQKKELSGVQEACRNSKEYVETWKKLYTNHCLELEELYERHDNDATDELKEIKYSLTEKAIEDLRHVQSAVIISDMLKLNVPRMHFQQALDEHKREAALLAQQLEKEESDKAGESRASLESTMRKLDEEFKLNVKEQKNLRNWEQCLFSKVLLLPLCVSEDDVHKIQQEFLCGFSQMDITLALPKIQGRLLLQKYQSDWRSIEMQKIEYRLLETERQSGSKMMKHPQDRAAEILKKSAEDKVLIYEAQITDDKIKQVRGELLLQRVHQLKAREYKLGEYLTSLQFQIVNSKSKMFAVHSALLQLQSLLLEEETKSITHNTSEYEQLLLALNQEIRDMDKTLETWKQRETTSTKLQEEDQTQVTADLSCEDDDLPVSATLRKALSRRKYFANLYRDRMQREEMDYALVEDQEERAQVYAMQRLYNQGTRLAAYLTKRSLVPEGMLQRVLSLLLPASSESEISSLLHSLGHKYSDRVPETGSIEDGADSWRKRKHQDLWVAMEKQIRESLAIQDEEKNTFPPRKKRSILKKKKLRPVKRVSFSHPGSFTKLLQSSAEALDIPDVEENLYIFRVPNDSPSPQSKPKKKRSFLNSKKSAAVLT
ncbi:limbin [Lithobates pipiens]